MNTPNEPNQRLIDAGAAALLRLPEGDATLARATAFSQAKDAGETDWRVCLLDACRPVYRISVAEQRDRQRGGGNHGLNPSV